METSDAKTLLQAQQYIQKLIKTITDETLPVIKKFLQNSQEHKILQSLKQYKSQNSEDNIAYTQKQLLTEVKEARGKNCLHFAAARGNVEILSYLLELAGRDSANLQDEAGNNLLHISVQHQHFQLSKYLLENKICEADTLREKKVSALHIAAMVGNLDLLEMLIQYGANVSLESEELGNALEWSVCYGQAKAVQLLLKKGARPSQQSSERKMPPPIIMAINLDSQEIFDLLIQNDENCVHNKDSQGWSALHFAAELGKTQFCKKLVEHKADPNYTKDNQTALDLAFQNQQWDAVSFLRPITKKQTEEIQKQSTQSKNLTQEEIERKILFSFKYFKDNKQQATALKQEGNNYFKEEKYQEALDLYTKGIELDPLNAILYSNRSTCNVHLGNYPQALKDAQKLKEIDPNWIKTYFREGEAYMNLKEYGDAAASFWEGLKIEPNNKVLKKLFDNAVKIGKEYHQNQQKKD